MIIKILFDNCQAHKKTKYPRFQFLWFWNCSVS